MKFCDMQCEYAAWPKDEAVDGAGSCRTFQAIYCEKKGRLVHKNLPCPDKIQRSKPDGFVKSPFAALRGILRHCGVATSTPHSLGFARLATGAFYCAVLTLTFYEFSKPGEFVKKPFYR